MFSCSPSPLNLDLHGSKQLLFDESLMTVFSCEESRFESEHLPNSVGCGNCFAFNNSIVLTAAVLAEA